MEGKKKNRPSKKMLGDLPGAKRMAKGGKEIPKGGRFDHLKEHALT